MPLTIVPYQSFYSSGGGGSGSTDHSHNNLAVLNSLKTDNKGNLIFNNNIIGEKAIEISHDLTLSQTHISNKYIELPEDCDIQRAITFTLEGVSQIRGSDWEVDEKDYPEKDRITWKDFSLEHLVQAGDKANITYYKKI